MTHDNPQRSTIIFGFDSAWTNKTPGAICAIAFDASGKVGFREPELVKFDQALKYIEEKRKGYDVSLVALDQPTIVPNTSGCRPVERVAASLVSFVGGGVQPANRGKIAMFGNDAPIWSFLSSLGATENPVEARSAQSGHFLIEVFPALALPSLSPSFAIRSSAPKYNPQNRRKFCLNDWKSVSQVVMEIANQFGVMDLVKWTEDMCSQANPRKCDQDRLDASICALIGLLWRARPENSSVMLGDLENGYIITPVSEATRPRLGGA